MIVEITQYKETNSGHIILKETPVNDTNKSKLIGIAGFSTPQGNMQLPIEFPEDMSLEDCFGNFETIAKQTLEDMRKEQNKDVLQFPGK